MEFYLISGIFTSLLFVGMAISYGKDAQYKYSYGFIIIGVVFTFVFWWIFWAILILLFIKEFLKGLEENGRN